MLVDAEAIRTDGLLTVKLIGQYPTPFDEAVVDGYYPGTVTHFTDPGSAQIFISVRRKPGFEGKCLPEVPGSRWFLNQVVRDIYHRMVEIYINGHLCKKIRVIDLTVYGMYNIIDL
jgi:hypothetical protein